MTLAWENGLLVYLWFAVGFFQIWTSKKKQYFKYTHIFKILRQSRLPKCTSTNKLIFSVGFHSEHLFFLSLFFVFSRRGQRTTNWLTGEYLLKRQLLDSLHLLSYFCRLSWVKVLYLIYLLCQITNDTYIIVQT